MDIQIDGFYVLELKILAKAFPKEIADYKALCKKYREVGNFCTLYNICAEVKRSLRDGTATKYTDLFNVIQVILTKLRNAGIPDPVFASSGNRWVFAFTYEGLVGLTPKGKRVMNKVAKVFDDPHVEPMGHDICIF